MNKNDVLFNEVCIDVADLTVKYHMFEGDKLVNFTIVRDSTAHTITVTNVNYAWMFQSVVISYNPKDLYEITSIQYNFKSNVGRKTYNNRLRFEDYIVDLFDILTNCIRTTTNYKMIINFNGLDKVEVEAYNDISEARPAFMQKLDFNPFDFLKG